MCVAAKSNAHLYLWQQKTMKSNTSFSNATFCPKEEEEEDDKEMKTEEEEEEEDVFWVEILQNLSSSVCVCVLIRMNGDFFSLCVYGVYIVVYKQIWKQN